MKAKFKCITPARMTSPGLYRKGKKAYFLEMSCESLIVRGRKHKPLGNVLWEVSMYSNKNQDGSEQPGSWTSMAWPDQLLGHANLIQKMIKSYLLQTLNFYKFFFNQSHCLEVWVQQQCLPRRSCFIAINKLWGF